MFIIARWIQPLVGICSQQSKAVCLILFHAGAPLHQPGAWWSCISMVIFSSS